MNSLEAAGQNVRKVYQRRLPSNTAKDYYFMHRDTGNTESVIVEYGFLDSTGDDVNQIKNNWEKYAEAVVKAIAEYAKINYIPVSGDYYVVKAGDTLYSIANNYNISLSDLKQANNLVSNTLNIGQILTIPLPGIIPLEEKNTYIVKAGDSLYAIANMYDTTVNELKNLNNLTSNILSIGQVLMIPDKEIIQNENTYIVKTGDTLYKIANMYNTTVNELKSLNNLTNDVLSIGKVLIIPTSNEELYDIYVVKSGDTLYSLARKYNITVDELKTINGLTTNLLSLNQQLKVPKN